MQKNPITGKKAKKRARHIAMRILVPILCLVVILVGWIAADIITALSIKSAPRKPIDSNWAPYDTGLLSAVVWLYGNKGQTNSNFTFTLDDLTEEFVLEALKPAKKYLNDRLDCADFKADYLLKLYFDGGEDLWALSPSGKIFDEIEDALTNFKFWLTSPGADSMCYYSENHQINFAVIEYLSGLAYPDSVFSVDGKTGSEHVNIGRKRIMEWLNLRFTYGFSECFSANYYDVDLGALTLLLNYGDRADHSLMQKTKMVLDILFMDFAMQMYDYTFVSPSGRAYQYNNLTWKNSEAAKVVDYVWGLNQIENLKDDFGSFGWIVNHNLELLKSGETPFYEIPEVILEIGRSNEKIVKTGTGLDLADFKSEGLLGQSDRQMMFQLGMGAINNPEIIQNMLDYINEYDLFTNNFLANLKYLNIRAFQMSGLLPFLVEKVNPYSNGFANQKYNVYTYMNGAFKLSTNQAYFPGSFGSQQLQSVALLPGGIPVYTTHPVDTLTGTPGYWSGYGVNPHAVQEENVELMIYHLPKRIPVLPDTPCDYTHTYFPEAEFDEVIVEDRYAFGRRGDTYIALIGSSNLTYLDRDETKLAGLSYKTSKRFDLIQYGEEQAWVYELSDASKESFAAFAARIKGNAFTFKGDTLSYQTAGKNLSVTYNGDFVVDNQIIDTDYKRYESEYCTADRDDGKYIYSYNGHTLTLDFENNIRNYT